MTATTVVPSIPPVTNIPSVTDIPLVTGIPSIPGIPPVGLARRTTLSLPGAAPSIRLSNERRALIEAMWSAPTRGWQLVPGIGLTVRWDRQVPTPRWAREPGGWDWRSDAAAPLWADSMCPQHVVVTLTAPSASPVLGMWLAPWAVRVDQSVTLARALAVLADPDSALDGSDQPQHLAPTRPMPTRPTSPRPTPVRPMPARELKVHETQRGARPDPGHRPDDPPYKVIGGIVYLTRTSR
jgi:hypothetical protein